MPESKNFLKRLALLRNLSLKVTHNPRFWRNSTLPQNPQINLIRFHWQSQGPSLSSQSKVYLCLCTSNPQVNYIFIKAPQIIRPLIKVTYAKRGKTKSINRIDKFCPKVHIKQNTFHMELSHQQVQILWNIVCH